MGPVCRALRRAGHARYRAGGPNTRMTAATAVVTVGAMQTMVPVGADRIWAEDSGGAGPPLVLLHSGVADARLWGPVWPQLAAAFRVIRYDSRATGPAGWASGRSA